VGVESAQQVGVSPVRLLHGEESPGRLVLQLAQAWPDTRRTPCFIFCSSCICSADQDCAAAPPRRPEPAKQFRYLNSRNGPLREVSADLGQLPHWDSVTSSRRRSSVHALTHIAIGNLGVHASEHEDLLPPLPPLRLAYAG